MSVPVLTFFNNKGGVGKTSLIYHLAWMYAHKSLRVLAADFDPQANLTAAFLDEESLEDLWPAGGGVGRTVFGGLSPLIRGIGDIAEPAPLDVADRIALLAGDLALSGFEDDLSSQWSHCLDGKERAFRVISAFWRLLMSAAEPRQSDVVLVDVGPNLGAINRAALVAADYVVLPLAPDLFSVQGLQNLGPRLRDWRKEWTDRLEKNPDPALRLPAGQVCCRSAMSCSSTASGSASPSRRTSGGCGEFQASTGKPYWTATNPRQSWTRTRTAWPSSSTTAVSCRSRRRRTSRSST